ncbi:MAG: glycosyltransferase [Gammaproteobacteria bacterium]|nr:glycosyltransferase [Gammaproteobacteria bacterium]
MLLVRAPLISICVPSYNSAHWLGDLIERVQRQSYGNFELLIVDDCSTDATAAVVNRYCQQDPRVRYRCNQHNLGAVGNAEACTQEASGEYLTILQSDDRYIRDDFLEHAVATMAQHPAVLLFYTGVWFINAQDERIKYSCYESDFVLPGKEALKLMMLRGSLWPSTALFRHQAFKAVGGFRKDVGVGQDLFCSYKLALRGEVAYWATATVEARLHASSVTVLSGKGLYVEFAKVLQRFRDEEGDLDGLQAAFESRATAMVDNYLHLQHNGYLVPRVDALLQKWQMDGATVVIYGAGQHTRELLANTRLATATVIALSDSDASLHGQQRWGYRIIAPEEIAASGASVVLISSAFHQVVIDALLRSLLPPQITITPLYLDEKA